MIDDEPQPAASAVSIDVVRSSFADLLTWIVVVGFSSVAALASALLDAAPGPGTFLIVTVLPLVALSVALVHQVRVGAWFGAGALLVAVSPVYGSLSVGDKWAALTVIFAVAASLVGSGAGGARTGLFFLGLFSGTLLVAWIGSNPSAAATPPLSSVWASTGRLMWDALGSLGELALAPTSAWLCWWVAVGLIAGVAVVGGDLWMALLVAVGVLVLIVAGSAMFYWRGDVDMSSGTWIVAGSIAFAGSSLPLARDRGRRMGLAVAVLTAVAWTATLVDLAYD